MPTHDLRIDLYAASSLLLGSLAYAQNIPAVQLVNDFSQDARTALNSGAHFATELRGYRRRYNHDNDQTGKLSVH